MVKYKIFLISCIICAILPLHAQGDNLHFRHFSKSEGMAFNSVRTIFQDDRGIVWIGTYNGLNTYDGIRMRTYTREDLGLSTAFIGSIISDGNGDVLIGTDDGLVIYQYSSARFCKAPGDEIPDRVFCMIKDADGNVWIGVRNHGLYHWDWESGFLKKIDLPQYNNASFYRLAMDKSKRLYASIYCDNIISIDLKDSEFPIKLIQPKNDTRIFEKDDIEGLVVNPLADNILYIASKRHGLCRMNMALNTVSQIYALPQEVRPTNLFYDNEFLWMSSTSGLLKIDPINKSANICQYSAQDPFSLSSNHVTTSYIDKMGSLWVGTEGRGLNLSESHLNNIQKFYMTSDGMPLKGALIRDFAEDRFGRVWVATQHKGLLCYRPQSGSLSKVAKVPENIITIEMDGDDLLLGYSDGIYRYNTLSGTLARKYSHFIDDGVEIDNRIIDIMRTYDGDIYVGASTGMLKYNRQKDEFQNIQEVQGFAVNAIIEDPSGNLWIATYSNGVLLYSPSQQRILDQWCSKTTGDPVGENVLSICLDENSDIWVVSFNSSFARYDRESSKFERIDKDTDSNLPTEAFLSILADSKGALWLPSDGSLVAYNPATRSVRTIDQVDHLLDLSTTHASSIRLKNGHLLFGSFNGFMEIDPVESLSQQMPQVMIVDFLVDGKTMLPSQHGSLEQNINTAGQVVFRDRLQASFGIELATPGVANHNSCDIYCRLNGYDDKARNVSTAMSAYWNNIPKGEYTLTIFTHGKAGQEIPLHADVKVVVKPSIWHTSMGIVVMILFIIIVLTGAFYIIWRYQKAIYDEQLTKANVEIAKYHETIERLAEREVSFIMKLEEVVDEHIADTEFSVALLEEKMCMSRSSLNRKIQGLYNTTPVGYLRNRRLEKAAELLRSGKWRINEVCYKTGFSSPSYFTKCFREHYKCLPVEYGRNSKK